jgi:hypothetical protein
MRFTRLDSKKEDDLITRDKMLALYATMVQCRRIAVEANPGTRPRDASYDPKDGLSWEATIAGVGAHLLAGDKLTAPQSTRVWEILRAMHGNSVLPILNGTGNSKLRAQGKIRKAIAAGPNANSAMPGDAFEEAAEAARNFKSAENGCVAVVFSEPVNGESNWRNRLGAAAHQRLPLLIVSGCTLRYRDAKASAAPPTQKVATQALAFGIPVITVDGFDVRAVYRVAGESIFRARKRRGPTLIECIVQAPAGSIAVAGRQPGFVDPILSMESYLTEKGILTAALKTEIEHSSAQKSVAARITQPR